MKILRLIIPTTFLATLGATASLHAGPGADYFRRVYTVSESAKAARATAAEAPTARCKVIEVVRITTGPRGMPIRQIVSTKMDCSRCNDSSMACCAGKAKS